MRGVEPKLAKDGRLELRAARHPLLIPAVRRYLRSARDVEPATDAAGEREDGRADAEPVPSTSSLLPPVHVLVITGPNTGGKTVALKTAGLLPLLAQAGLLIPVAEDSQIPVFKSVFADIGDEQSIAQSLSTFSGHIANIVAMDAALETPALVLLDEAGAGTDPVEGGALAMSIIEHFRAARRDGDRHDALRRAQDLRIDHRGRDAGRIRLRSRRRSRRPTGSTTGRRAAAWRSRSPTGSACRRPSSSAPARTAASAKRCSPITWRGSSATCSRSSTIGGSPPASGRCWPRRRRSSSRAKRT